MTRRDTATAPIPPARRVRVLCALALVSASLFAGAVRAGEAAVAVAANFLQPLERLAPVFRQQSGQSLRITSGSTGQLYAQIRNGAPFDVFLAADRRRPALLEKEGLTVAGSRLTYAVGTLVLWSADPDRIPEGKGPELLARGRFRHLAIAKPELAPYGEAARRTLQALGLWRTLVPKLVQGQNVAQTFQFVLTGNAEVGFVALSQVRAVQEKTPGSRWVVPARLHQPIRQDAVLLQRAKDNAAARDFMRFLRSGRAATLIRSFGYSTPGTPDN